MANPRTELKKRRILLLVMRHLLFLMAITSIILGIVFLLMRWRWPSVVDVSLTVNRVAFIANGINSDTAPILDAVTVQSLSVNSFESIKFSPAKLEVSDPDPRQYDLEAGRFKDSAWHSLAPNMSQVIVKAGEKLLNPNATIVGDKAGSDNLMSIYPVLAKSNSSVILQIPPLQQAVSNNKSNQGSTLTGGESQTSELRMTLTSQEPYQDILINGPIQLNTQHCSIEGVQDPLFNSQTLTYKVGLRENSPSIGITGRDNALGLVLMVPFNQADNVFPKSGMIITTPEFIRESSQTKTKESSLVEGTEGIITYPDYPKIEKVSFKALETIWMDDKDQFTVKEIKLKPEVGGIYMHLVGKTGQLVTGIPGLEGNEHYITAFTVLQQNPTILALLGAVGWVVPTILSIRKFIIELVAELKQQPVREQNRPPRKKRRRRN
jgi:hypothetical protein